jgi:Holliday junction DNA helicase RuvA
MLLGVPGVGPKAALAILSATTPDQLALAIVTGDEKSLTAAPGIGKKIAQRIILELKDKLSKEQTGFSVEGGSVSVAVKNDKANEAAAALAVLGYTSQDIGVALKGIDIEALPLEEIIRQALKKMVR